MSEVAGRSVPGAATRRRARQASVPGFTLLAGAHDAGTALPAHAHADPTLCYLLDGRFTEYAHGRSLDCETDTLKLTAAGETHSNKFPHAAVYGLRVDIARSRFADSTAILRLLDGEFFLPRSGAHPLAHRLIAEMEAPDDAAALVMESLLLELLARLAREHSTKSARDLPEFLRRAEEMILATFRTPITLADVAHGSGVSSSTLARAYRTRFRTSVGERVRRLRVEWAAQEIVRSTESLSIIALKAGFYDQAHFANVFRRLLGTTPARYREAATRSD